MKKLPKELMPYAQIIKDIRDKKISLRSDNEKLKKLLYELTKSNVPWSEISKLLKRDIANISRAIKFHFPKVKNLRRIKSVPKSVLRLIKQFVAKSFEVPRRQDSSKLNDEMFGEVNKKLKKLGLAPISKSTLNKNWINGILKLSWGWPRPGYKEGLIEIIKRHYGESQKLANAEDAEKLRHALFNEVNKFRLDKYNLDPINLGGISHVASSGLGLNWGWPKKKDASVEKDKKSLEEQSRINAQNVVKERNWQEPLEFKVDENRWHNKEGVRIGLISRVDYKMSGYRAGLLELAYEIFAEEAVHFIVLNGGLVSKNNIIQRIRELTAGQRMEDRSYIIDSYLNEAAKELAVAIPKLKKPGKENEFVRLYITTSPLHDGHYGEEIARRLVALRPHDIRQDNSGGARLTLKGLNKVVWFINPKKNRLPSKFYSTTAEREITDKEGQTTQGYPDMWIVGGGASAVFKPKGEKKRPYGTIPAISRPEEVITAENQVGLAILDFPPNNGTHSVRLYSFKDLVSNERRFITGIKDGATEFHKKIVETIKESGAMTVGLLSDALQVSREKISESIKFLVEPESLSRKTWPGLHYNESSQRYDFYLDWLQEKLRYPWASDFKEDKILFFGCLHAGYTTTDYEYIVKDLPLVALERDIDVICGLGDFVAGLAHDFMHSGEIIGSLNVTEQETFAAELVGTLMCKVFNERYKKFMGKENPSTLVEKLLPYFVCIQGNHDMWPKRHGITPLVVFKDKLVGLLRAYLSKIFINEGSSFDIVSILTKKIVEVDQCAAVYKLPSGLSMELYHPHMPSGGTTSLRAQKMIEVSPESQIIGGANFHTAIVVHKWQPDIGQRVAAQAGTLVIYTHFEHHKLKVVDFGVVYLRTCSRNERIIVTESAFYGKSHLSKPRVKWTNIAELKNELGIIKSE